MATSTGLIIVTNPGFVPPKKFMQMAYASFPTFGASVASLMEDKTAELVISQDAPLPDLDKLLSGLEDNKDIPSVLYFANSKVPLLPESEQPFTIISDDNNNPLIAGFIEGDYVTKQHADSKQTDEYHLFDDVLGPQLRKIYNKLCGGDLAKFEDELVDEDTEKLINSFAANRGIIVLQSVSGKVFKFETGNDLAGEYPWGWVSNNLGFKEESSKEYVKLEEPEKEPEPTPKRTSMTDRFKAKKTTVPVIASTTPVTTTIAKENTKTDTALPDHAGRPMISCPEDIRKKGKNAYTGWYEAHTINIGLTKDQMKNGAEAPANDDWIAKNSGKHMKLADAKEQLLQKIKDSKAKLPDPPIIQPQTRHIINTLLDSGEIKAKLESGRILSSEELKAPPKVAPWSAQFGRDIMQVYRWDREIIESFIDKCETNKDRLGVVLLIEELIREQLKMLLDEKKPSDTKAEEQINTEKANDVTAKTAETKEEKVDNVPPTPPKTSMSRFAKKAA